MLKDFSLVFFVFFANWCIVGVNSGELKHLTNELEIKVPANEVWQLYRNLGFSMLTAQKLKNSIQGIKVLKGNGGVGTVLRFTLVPGNSSYTEKFVVIDDKKRVKVSQGLSGDCLAYGCSVEIVRFDIIEKSETSSIVKFSIYYAVKKEFKAKNPKPIQFLQLSAAAGQVAKKFLESKHI
ncbi:hypothetical protein PTKIN_Ptkin11bG0154200 [Pterospermum kingtungense]